MTKKTKPDAPMAKMCFSHIGGKLGTRLMDRFEEMGWIKPDTETKHFRITPKGEKGFHELGVDTSDLNA